MTYVEGDGEGRCGSAGECSARWYGRSLGRIAAIGGACRSFVVVVAACRSWCWRSWSWSASAGGGEHGGYAYVGGVFGRKCGLCWWCWLWGWCRSGGSHGWSSLSGSRPRIGRSASDLPPPSRWGRLPLASFKLPLVALKSDCCRYCTIYGDTCCEHTPVLVSDLTL